MTRLRPLLPLLLAWSAWSGGGADDRHLAARRTGSRSPSIAIPNRGAGAGARTSLAERLCPDQRDPPDRRSRPARSMIRFEGVAGGILPQSAIVTGFPEGIVERNRDAYLLSPATLLDRSLGRRVHLRRTSRATGAVREQEAVDPHAAPTARSCSRRRRASRRCAAPACPRRSVYDRVPPELSADARPCRCAPARAQPVTATVTLSYLATGFDWQANYVVDARAGRPPRRPVRLADPGEHRRDQLPRCRHPGRGGQAQL